MTVRLLLLILASVSLSALAQLALKIGTTAAAGGRSTGIGGEIGGLAQSPMIILGLGLYGIGALLWLFVLGRAPLSLAYPFVGIGRSEEHTSELQSLMRISYAVFCLKKKTKSTYSLNDNTRT